MPLQIGCGKLRATFALPDIAHDTAAIAVAVHVENQNRQTRDAVIPRIESCWQATTVLLHAAPPFLRETVRPETGWIQHTRTADRAAPAPTAADRQYATAEGHFGRVPEAAPTWRPMLVGLPQPSQRVRCRSKKRAKA